MSRRDSEKSSIYDDAGERHFIHAQLDYVGEKGGNGAEETIQTTTGAPVEVRNPLGYNVGFWTTLLINVSHLVGTGIFSTPSNILTQTGSVGLSLIFWVIGFLINLTGISVYLELASYFPSRSGSEVVYLEQAYPHPKYLFPVAFAVNGVLLTFSLSNGIVCAQYLFRVANVSASAWAQKGVAIASMTLVCATIVVSTKWSLRIINASGVLKLATLIFMTITGFVVLSGKTSVPNPKANFQDSFKGTNKDAYSLSNGLVSVLFAYGGYANSFNLVNEVKDPIRVIKKTANTALVSVAVLYLLVNIAYLSAVPAADIKKSSQTTAALFFKNVFGTKAGQALSIIPALSALGNMLASVTANSRMIREIGRQGLLPFPKFWVSTRPFGTPLGPLLIIWLMTVLMISAPPAGQAFNFLVALKSYPDSFFLALMTFGLFLIRRQRKKAGLPRTQYRSWSWVAGVFFAAKVFLLVMPWVPPRGTLISTSFGFFYAASSLTGLGIIGLCGVYYLLWTKILPRLGGYKIRQTVIQLSDGAISSYIIKVPNADVEEWDRKHDPSGRSIDSGSEPVTRTVNLV
ncbi:hypothetical protein VHUM_01948 [Vanrija humicola]|uniref:Amino acid permease/ SLC12A domain-containing protein n=1 Tax=Vanrija humicola TaxID=5417 RepID=A0A7D8Z1W7_VANHU|nr:hypothetical protein VHUM_01948 [Vanrija humicola]